MSGHRLLGLCLLHTGNILEARAHFDRALALYDPMEHRPLAMNFGVDAPAVLSWRSFAQWLLGYPAVALTDAERALVDAHEIGHHATLMQALRHSSMTHIGCGDYAAANALIDEVVALADKKGDLHAKASGIVYQGVLLALTGNASDAIQVITSGIAALQSTGATFGMPWYLSLLARGPCRARPSR
jgi:hypothetical protein